MAKGLSTGVWETCQWTHPQRRMILSPSDCLPMLGFCLALWRYVAHNHRCCEITIVWAMSCPGDSISHCSCHPPTLNVLPSLPRCSLSLDGRRLNINVPKRDQALSLLLSALWPVLRLSTVLCPLQKETPLSLFESNPGPYVPEAGRESSFVLFQVMLYTHF